MKAILTTIVLFAICGLLQAQTNDSLSNDSVYAVVDNPPKFPGGDEALHKYLKKNTRMPQTDVMGNVFVQVIVEKDGAITEAKVLRGIGGGCDEEALRVVKYMPKWIPGRQKGVPVRVYYNIPVRFTF